MLQEQGLLLALKMMLQSFFWPSKISKVLKQSQVQ